MSTNMVWNQLKVIREKSMLEKQVSVYPLKRQTGKINVSTVPTHVFSHFAYL